MKKLLVLMLVLGMASLASAGLTFATGAATIQVGGTVDISMLADQAVAGTIATTDLIGGAPNGASTISLAAGAASTAFAANDQAGNGYPGYIQGIAGTVTPYVLGDEVSIVGLTGDAVGTYTIYSYSAAAWASSGSATDSFTLTVVPVPEPITMGLLAVGGLFLRRRK